MFHYSASLTDKPKTAEAGVCIACIPNLSVVMLFLAFSRVVLPGKYECGFSAYAASQIRTSC